MLRFKNYLSEEVLPTAGVKDGGIDIENNAVRAQINATLSNVTAQPAVTPYIVLHRISKALAYFHIILPKRAYLEGDRGVEVIEVKQFGHKMGMTNDGQFVHDVPSKYFLFISYRLASSMGADYSAVGDVLSSVGGMFKVTAKLVDEVELQRLLSMAEVSLAESCDAETQQSKAKAMAPKEMMHTALGDCDCSQGDSPSTKSAVSTMMRKTDKKLSADSLDEDLMNEKRGLWDNIHAKRARIKAGSGEKMRKPGSKGAPSSDDIKLARNEEVEEIDEASYDKLDKYVRKAHVSGTGAAARGEIAMHRGQKTRLHRANKTGEKREQGINLALDKMAGRALVPAKRKEKMEEAYEKVEAGVKKRDGETHTLHRRNPGHKTEYHTITSERDGRKSVKTGSPKYIKKHWDKMEEAYGVYRKGGSIGEKPSKEPHKTFDSAEEAKSHAKGMNKQLSPGEKKYYGIKYHVKPIKEEETLDEKLTKAMSAGDVISDFVHSKDPKFKGKSKKERQKMALGAYYGMHPEKSKLEEASRLKKTTAHRKFAAGVNTKTREALGSKSDESKTILVTRKGDPRAAAGGGVRRIPKEKFDPAIYNRASE